MVTRRVPADADSGAHGCKMILSSERAASALPTRCKSCSIALSGADGAAVRVSIEQAFERVKKQADLRGCPPREDFTERPKLDSVTTGLPRSAAGLRSEHDKARSRRSWERGVQSNFDSDDEMYPEAGPAAPGRPALGCFGQIRGPFRAGGNANPWRRQPIQKFQIG